jgi:hypothetical protein
MGQNLLAYSLAKNEGGLHGGLSSPPRKRGSRGYSCGLAAPWIPAFEGVTQSRFWRDVSPGDQLNLGVCTSVGYC